jgi:hypothetical protein
VPYDKPKYLSRTEAVDCSVFGGEVEINATYMPTTAGERSLVDFTCSLEGKCGVPSWDPCPLFVRYLEQTGEDR